MTLPDRTPKGLSETFTEKMLEFNALSPEEKAEQEGENSSLDRFIDEVKRPKPKS
jgi:hypothetical protein